MNLTNPATVTVTNLSAPWVLADVHYSSVVSGGPSLGTFNFFIDNPGPGGSQNNDGPLTFNISDPGGISFANFIKSSGSGGGYYFVADIGIGSDTGMSGISNDGVCTGQCVPSVPEPSSMLLLGTTGLGILLSLKRRFKSGERGKDVR